MFKNLKQIILISLLVLSTPSIAQKIVKIGVGNFPPFFIEKGNKGVFIEVVDKIFEQLPEYRVEYIFMSNHRILHEINNGKLIDVACNIFPNSQVNTPLSEPLFRFRDVAISIKSKQLKINNISDLQRKSIAAYQGATEFLGDEFKNMAKENTEYSEYAHPKDTTFLMVSGIKDIRIGDINIFRYDLNNKFYNKNVSIDHTNFSIHYLWPYVYSHMAFKDISLRDKVNEVIKQLQLDGSIDKIYSKHEIQ